MILLGFLIGPLGVLMVVAMIWSAISDEVELRRFWRKHTKEHPELKTKRRRAK